MKFQSIILIFKKVINSKITNLKFRKQLSKELISDYLTIKKDKSKREKYFKDCKLVKINVKKRCVFNNYLTIFLFKNKLYFYFIKI